MDKVNALYEELLSYDSSLGENKERVLQLIQKMIDAKPILVINEQWKQSFAEKLSDHIAISKAVSHSSSSFFSFSRWSVSVLSTFIVLTLAGASYRGLTYHNNAKVKTQNPKLHTEESLEHSQDTYYNTESANKVSDTTAAQEPSFNSDSREHTTVAVDNKGVVVDAEVKQSAMSNDQTIPQFAKGSPVAYDASVSNTNTISTDMDNEDARMMMQSSGAMGGGVDSIEPAMAAASMAKASVEQKVIALVVIDPSGTGLSAGALAIVTMQDLPITYVSGKEKLLVTHLSGTMYAVSENNISTISSSVEARSMIMFERNYVSAHPEKFEMLVRELKAAGYVFVSLSVMQQ